MAVIRRYPLSFFREIFIIVLMILAPFFFLYLLFHQGWWGIALFFLVLFIGLLLGFRLLVIYYLNGVMITNQRLIDFDQKGFFSRTISETSLDKIQDITIEVKGPWQTIFSYGSIVIQTAATTTNLELKGVKGPNQVQDLITKAQKQFSSKETVDNLSAAELIELVGRIKKGVGTKEIEQLMNKSKKKPL